MSETPEIRSSNVSSNVYYTDTGGNLPPVVPRGFTQPGGQLMGGAAQNMFMDGFRGQITTTQGEENMKRIVRVVIGDPHDRVPVDKSILVDSGEIMTDLSDQELYFDQDISGALKKHNEMRTKITTRKGGKTKLDAARVRDLVMTVVEIVTF